MEDLIVGFVNPRGKKEFEDGNMPSLLLWSNSRGDELEECVLLPKDEYDRLIRLLINGKEGIVEEGVKC